MKGYVGFIFVLVAILAICEAFPADLDNGLPNLFVRSRRSPARVMMLSGFYRPANRRQGYVGEIPASPCKSCGGETDSKNAQEVDLQEEQKNELFPEDDSFQDEAPQEEETPKEVEDEEVNVEEEKPVRKPAKKERDGPSVNTYFPIQFGSASRATAGAPGVLAIANSFSTGKRGVAKSVATAYGSHPANN